MPETLWYEHSETKVTWHVEIGSEAQLRLATDPAYRPLEFDPAATVIQDSKHVSTASPPVAQNRIVVSGLQAPKGKV